MGPTGPEIAASEFDGPENAASGADGLENARSGTDGPEKMDWRMQETRICNAGVCGIARKSLPLTPRRNPKSEYDENIKCHKHPEHLE